MSTSNPNVQQRNQYGRDWGNYAAATDLPNAAAWAGGANAAAPLEAGDTAYVTGTGRYHCTSAGTIGALDATWAATGGTIREILIENGVTLVAGDVVRSQTPGQVSKAAVGANNPPAIGIVLVGGVGDGLTVYALVALQGYVSGLSGLTSGGVVYVSTTAGAYTTTIPSASGAEVQVLGEAISTTEMILNVQAPRPPALINQPLDGEQTGTAELSLGMIYLRANSIIGAGSHAMLGASSGVSDTADLRIRRFTGGAQVAIFSATGTPADTAITAAYTVAASDWYEFTLAAGGAAQVAVCPGVVLHVYGETV